MDFKEYMILLAEKFDGKIIQFQQASLINPPFYRRARVPLDRRGVCFGLTIYWHWHLLQDNCLLQRLADEPKNPFLFSFSDDSDTNFLKNIAHLQDIQTASINHPERIFKVLEKIFGYNIIYSNFQNPGEITSDDWSNLLPLIRMIDSLSRNPDNLILITLTEAKRQKNSLQLISQHIVGLTYKLENDGFHYYFFDSNAGQVSFVEPKKCADFLINYLLSYHTKNTHLAVSYAELSPYPVRKSAFDLFPDTRQGNDLWLKNNLKKLIDFKLYKEIAAFIDIDVRFKMLLESIDDQKLALVKNIAPYLSACVLASLIRQKDFDRYTLAELETAYKRKIKELLENKQYNTMFDAMLLSNNPIVLLFELHQVHGVKYEEILKEAHISYLYLLFKRAKEEQEKTLSIRKLILEKAMPLLAGQVSLLLLQVNAQLLLFKQIEHFFHGKIIELLNNQDYAAISFIMHNEVDLLLVCQLAGSDNVSAVLSGLLEGMPSFFKEGALAEKFLQKAATIFPEHNASLAKCFEQKDATSSQDRVFKTLESFHLLTPEALKAIEKAYQQEQAHLNTIVQYGEPAPLSMTIRPIRK